jgi:hypothetical protein
LSGELQHPKEGYSVQEQVFSPAHGGWIWAVVTTRDTPEGAIDAATSYAAHRESIGVVPCGMRVMDLLDGRFVWDDLETLEERRKALYERVEREKREREAKALTEQPEVEGHVGGSQDEPKPANAPGMGWPAAVAWMAFFAAVAVCVWVVFG